MGTLMGPYPCWEERFTDPWLVLVRSKVKPPKLKPKRRKRRRPDAPRGESNTTEGLSTLLKPLVASEDPTLMQHKYVLCTLISLINVEPRLTDFEKFHPP